MENYEKTIKYIFDYFCGVLSTRATHRSMSDPIKDLCDLSENSRTVITDHSCSSYQIPAPGPETGSLEVILKTQQSPTVHNHAQSSRQTKALLFRATIHPPATSPPPSHSQIPCPWLIIPTKLISETIAKERIFYTDKREKIAKCVSCQTGELHRSGGQHQNRWKRQFRGVGLHVLCIHNLPSIVGCLMGEGRDSLGCYTCVQSRYPSQLHPLGGVHHLGHFSV